MISVKLCMKTNITENYRIKKTTIKHYFSAIYHLKKVIKSSKELYQLLVFRLIIALLCITKTKKCYETEM